MQPVRIDVVAFQDSDGSWIAQGIQYDIVAKAKRLIDIRKAFERQLIANLRINEKLGRSGFDGIPQAPDRFRRAFERAVEHMNPLIDNDRSGTALPMESIDIRLSEAA